MPLPIWQELLVGIEMAYLRVSPVYWGYGIPKGDGSPVVVIPGFLFTDFYLGEFRAWLRRIGYKPYFSNIGRNAECPNLLLKQRLNQTILKAHRATRRKVHLVGHSLGGVLARAVAAEMPDRIASVTTMSSPFRGLSVHRSVARTVNIVRKQILAQHGDKVLPSCYTAACTCSFLNSVMTQIAPPVRQTAIYTKTDGVVDWRVCMTGDPSIDVEVTATHIGMAFNPLVFEIVAKRLAAKRTRGTKRE